MFRPVSNDVKPARQRQQDGFLHTQASRSGFACSPAAGAGALSESQKSHEPRHGVRSNYRCHGSSCPTLFPSCHTPRETVSPAVCVSVWSDAVCWDGTYCSRNQRNYKSSLLAVVLLTCLAVVQRLSSRLKHTQKRTHHVVTRQQPSSPQAPSLLRENLQSQQDWFVLCKTIVIYHCLFL